MANGSTADKARKARNKANETFGGVSRAKTERIVSGIAKVAGAKLTTSEKERATNLMQTRRNNDRSRTAARATFIAGPNSPASKRAAAKRMAATTGEPMKQMPKVKITGSAATKPRVSNSMISSQPKTFTKPKATSLTKKVGKK